LILPNGILWRVLVLSPPDAGCDTDNAFVKKDILLKNLKNIRALFPALWYTEQACSAAILTGGCLL
jgi:hypothetical protein